MHFGHKYTFLDYLRWTKREIFVLSLWATVPTFLYAVVGWTFLTVPWTLVALLGTAVAFVISFKNVECHKRISDAVGVWNGIESRSKAFAITLTGYIHDADTAETRRLHDILFRQHFAWLTALRFQLRVPKVWENLDEPGNKAFMAFYTIPERQTRLDDELARYLPEPVLATVLAYSGDKANYILSLQSRVLADAYRCRQIDSASIYASVQGVLNELVMLQGAAQRIKDFPYARNFYSITIVLLRMFVALVPFALIGQLDDLGRAAGVARWMVWTNVPFSLMVSWIFVTLEKVGENSSNPFEGGANDVPISRLSSQIEFEMRRMLGESGLVDPPAGSGNIVL